VSKGHDSKPYSESQLDRERKLTAWGKSKQDTHVGATNYHFFGGGFGRIVATLIFEDFI
jgi:hypothetical protein